MVQLFHNLHFALDRLSPRRFCQLELIVNLDGDLLVQDFVQAQTNNSVSSLAYSFAYDVVVQILNRASACTELQVLFCRCAFLLVDLGFV